MYVCITGPVTNIDHYNIIHTRNSVSVNYKDNLIKLYNSVNRLLSLLGTGIPILTPCERTWSQDGVSYNTYTKYTWMLVNAFVYIVNNNKQLEQAIKKQLCILWKKDIKKYLPLLQEPWNASNSSCIMTWTHLSRRNVNTLNKLAYKQFGHKLFASKHKIKESRTITFPVLDEFISVNIKPKDKNQHKVVHSKMVTIYKFSLLLAFSMCVDGYINNNNFKPIKHLCGPDQTWLPAMMGGDKCTVDDVGCYVFSVGINGPSSSSAVHSIVSLFSYGQFVDDIRWMNEVFHRAKYDVEIEAVQRFPAVITIVKYSSDTDTDSDIDEMVDNNSNNSDIEEMVDNNSSDSDIEDMVGNNSSATNSDISFESRLASSCVIGYFPQHHQHLNKLLIPKLPQLRKKWHENNPIKSYNYEDQQEHKNEQTVKYQYNTVKASQMGLDQFTDSTKTPTDNTKYNWQSALQHLKQFLNDYTPDSDLLISKGYYCDNNQNANSDSATVINNMCSRSIAHKSPSKDLKYVDQFVFTNGLFSLY